MEFNTKRYNVTKRISARVRNIIENKNKNVPPQDKLIKTVPTPDECLYLYLSQKKQ